MTYARIYLQVEETEVSWCEHRVNDSDVEYVMADPTQRAEAVQAATYTCPGCRTEFIITAQVQELEVLVEGGVPE